MYAWLSSWLWPAQSAQNVRDNDRDFYAIPQQREQCGPRVQFDRVLAELRQRKTTMRGPNRRQWQTLRRWINQESAHGDKVDLVRLHALHMRCADIALIDNGAELDEELKPLRHYLQCIAVCDDAQRCAAHCAALSAVDVCKARNVYRQLFHDYYVLSENGTM